MIDSQQMQSLAARMSEAEVRGSSPGPMPAAGFAATRPPWSA